MNLSNVYTVDGLITRISFENGFADITMGDHVFGGSLKEENEEMERVTKKGGMIIYCSGNNDEDDLHLSLVMTSFFIDSTARSQIYGATF